MVSVCSVTDWFHFIEIVFSVIELLIQYIMINNEPQTGIVVCTLTSWVRGSTFNLQEGLQISNVDPVGIIGKLQLVTNSGWKF